MPASPARRVAAAVGLLVLMGGGAAAEVPPLSFGVLNQQSPTLTAERWNPILGYLGRAVGRPMRLSMGATVERTNELMAQGAFDFIFTVHNFRPEYDELGLRVVARWGLVPARAVIAVPLNSGLSRLEDLAGRRVAFPSAYAFYGYALPRLALREAGVAVEEAFAGNQEGALALLRAGRADAAAVSWRFLVDYGLREGVPFSTLFVSPPYPDQPVLAHPRVPLELFAAVREALLGMADDPEGAAILDRVRSPGFFPATDAEYDEVRAAYRRAMR